MAAMRRWLDGLNSTKAQPNENLAREFLELFALGEGHYSERDVREVARALTGWIEVDFQQHRDQFDPGRLRRRAQDDPGRDRQLGPGRRGADRLPSTGRRHSHRPAALPDVHLRYRRTVTRAAGSAGRCDANRGRRRRRQGDRVVLRSRLFHSEECRGTAREEPGRFRDRGHPRLRAVCARRPTWSTSRST